MILEPVAHPLPELFIRLIVLVLRGCIADELGSLGPRAEPGILTASASRLVREKGDQASYCELITEHLILFNLIYIQVESRIEL